MEYSNEKSNVELDVLVLTNEEAELYNRIFSKAVKSRLPRIEDDFIRDVNRVIMTDSLNSVEFYIKTAEENKQFVINEEQNHDRIEQEYQQAKIDNHNKQVEDN